MITIPKYGDSVDKIVGAYFRVFTSEPFEYKGKKILPKVLRVSPGLMRGFTCPEMCGACCLAFTLDWLPGEDLPDNLALVATVNPRTIEFNGNQIEVITYAQDCGPQQTHCHLLDKEIARCTVHGWQPFSCFFEVMRTSCTQLDTTPNGLNTRLFGRAWAMPRANGERGALCTLTPVTPETTAEAVARLERLRDWLEHFKLKSCVDDVLEWVRAGPHSEPGYFNLHVSKPESPLLGGL